MAAEPKSTSSFECAQQALRWQGPLRGLSAWVVRQKIEAILSPEAGRLTAGACGNVWVLATNTLPMCASRCENLVGISRTALRPDAFAVVLQLLVFIGGCRLVKTHASSKDTDAPIWLDCAPDTSTCQNGFDIVDS